MNRYKFILICVFLIFNTFVYPQHTDIYFTNFNQPNSESASVYIDSSHHNNIWQAGNPKKYFFRLNHPTDTTSMVTLLTKPYPPSNTSIFTVVFKPDLLPENIEHFSLRFSYQIDTDTLSDIGYVEVSPDMGVTWDNLSSSHSKYVIYRLFQNAEYDSFYFTGRAVFMHNAMPNISFGIKGDFLKCNTLMFRFTIRSDSIDTNKEGWCINEVFLFVTRGNGIDNQNKDNNKDLLCYYIDDNKSLFFKLQGSEIKEYRLYDINGKMVKESKVTASSATLSSENLPAGFYTLAVSNMKGKVFYKKIVFY
jgi:hypothetical protein